EAGDEGAERCFAHAREAGQGYVFPGPDAQAQLLEHVVGTVVVGEADVPELDVAAHGFQLNGVWRILDIRLDFQNIDEPLKTGDAFLIEPGEVDQALDRLDDEAHIEQVGQQVSQVQRAVDDSGGAGDDHGDGDEV